jgi:hypothetical protein
MRKLGALLVVLILCGVITEQAVAVNIVTNGGFETGNFSAWTFSGSTDYNFVTPAGPPAPHSGTYHAVFGEIGSLAFIDQDLPTTPGGTYDLTFWLLNNNSGVPNRYQVSWDGSVVLDVTDAAAFGYTLFTLSGLTASTASTELKFGFRHDPSIFALDDISVEAAAAVPEPSSLALLVLGAIGLKVAYRRRARSA